MVDAADPRRLDEAKGELDGLMVMQELKDVPIVVFGNKIDRKDALKEDEFREAL